MTTRQLYEVLLTQVDWYYEQADDPRASSRGRASVRHARQLAEALGDEGRDLFNAFRAHYCIGSDSPPLPPVPAS